MARLKVKVRFRDILNKTTFYEVGQEVEFSDEVRVKNIVSKGLAEIVNNADSIKSTESKTADVAKTPKPKSSQKPKPNNV